MWYAIIIVVVAIVAFIWWRWTSVARGAEKRDAEVIKHLDPLGMKLEKRERIEAREVEALAKHPQLRPFLYRALYEFQRLELFPERYLSLAEQAKAEMAYWLMHPNEEGTPPEEVDVVETVERTLAGKRATFFVLRFRMSAGHPRADVWQLGLAGPFFEHEEPYNTSAGAFSRGGDRYGSVAPCELVDWYIGIMKAKGFSAVQEG